MDRKTKQTLNEIVAEVQEWVKTFAEQSEQLRQPAELWAFEQRFRGQGLQMLGSILGKLLQNAVDHQDQEQQRVCPKCGQRRRHKGRRTRGLLSSVGAIQLEGVYWYCPNCGGQHAADTLAPQSSSRPMQQLLCLMGTSMASFGKASFAAEKLLGIRVSDATIRRLCYEHGRKVAIDPVSVEPGTDLVGSCDGTMVNTRQGGWRELKAYLFYHGEHKHGRAYLESSRSFTRRLRRAATALKAGNARRLFWLSDAAEWISKGVRVQLPMVIHIIDIWHARERIHKASREVYPAEDQKARRWADRYCEILEGFGGRALWRRLGKTRYRQADRQEAVDGLRRYLQKHASGLAYPEFKALGYPISSGPMESFCKQLGQRLKGPGMRWNTENVSPMANMVSLWANAEWDRHWQKTA